MPPFPTPSAPLPRRTRLLLACGLSAPLFLVVLLVEGALRPGYEPLHRFGSELALGDRGWVQTANFVGTGLLVLAFSAGLHRSLTPGRGSRALPLLTALTGACLVVAGVFPTDPLVDGATAGEPTLAGTLHTANVLPFHAALAGAALVAAWRARTGAGQRAWAWYCLGTGALVLASFALSMALAGDGFHGLWQRIALAAGLGWCAATAWRSLHSPGPQHDFGFRRKGMDGTPDAC